MKIVQSGAAIATTSNQNFGKYAGGVADLFNSGNRFRVSVKPNWVTSSDKKALNQFLKLVENGKIIDAFDLTFESNEGKEIKFKQITKPKNGANMGDTAEGVFAAAIACRFVLESKRRGSEVNTNDVFKMLQSLPKINNASEVQKEYDAPNNRTRVKDKVTLIINLDPANLAFLLNPKSETALMEYAVASCRYANSTNVKKWAKTVWDNGTKDKIKIKAAGPIGQRTTKVDVSVEITDHNNDPMPVDIQVSLKIDDVKQFGQKGGINFSRAILNGKSVEGYKEYFSRLFGHTPHGPIDLNSAFEKKYVDLIESKKEFDAVMMMYDKIYNQLNDSMKKWGTDRRGTEKRLQLFNTIGKAMEYYATLGQEKVTLVQLSRHDTRVYNFKGLGDKLANETLRIEWKKGTRGPLPSILIVKDKGKFDGVPLVIFRLRQQFRSDGTSYYRNLVEKGPYLTKLISGEVK